MEPTEVTPVVTPTAVVPTHKPGSVSRPLAHGSWMGAGPVAAEGGHTLDETYRTLAPAVLGYLRSHGAPEPEDLVGEVFVHVARGLARFRGEDAALRRWVFTIAHRRLVDTFRRRAARPDNPIADQPEVAVHDPPALLDVDLVAALAELTPLQREVVLLRFLADLPLADVARIVHRRVGAVKALQARTLDQLARRLAG